MTLSNAQVLSQIPQAYQRTAAEIAAGVTPTNYAYPPYTIMRYGADPTGVLDSTTALQSAINCAQAAQFGIVTVGIQSASLKIGSAWNFEADVLGIDFEGAYIDASAFPANSGNWCTIKQANSNTNLSVPLNTAHAIRNATFNGPGPTVAGDVCLYLNDTRSTPMISAKFHNVGFVNWTQDVVLGAGSNFVGFSQCDFAMSDPGAGAVATYSITMTPGSTNAGERYLFQDCGWYSKTYCINQGNVNSDCYLIGCSLDGSNRAVNVSGGNVILHGCHLETAVDNDYYLYCTGANSAIFAVGCRVNFDVARAAYALGYSDASVDWGGLFIDDLVFGASAGYSLPLIAGTGNARATRVYGVGTAAGQPHIYSLAQNAMGDNIFQNNSLARDGWTSSGGAPPAIVASNPYSGTYSVEFNPAASQTSVLTGRIIPCKPGQQGCVRAFSNLPAFNTGAAFTGVCGYVDAAGNFLPTLVGGTPTAGEYVFMDITAAQAAYQEFTSASGGGLALAPPGTVGFQVEFELTTGSAGGATGYLGEVDVTVD